MEISRSILHFIYMKIMIWLHTCNPGFVPSIKGLVYCLKEWQTKIGYEDPSLWKENGAGNAFASSD